MPHAYKTITVGADVANAATGKAVSGTSLSKGYGVQASNGVIGGGVVRVHEGVNFFEEAFYSFVTSVIPRDAVVIGAEVNFYWQPSAFVSVSIALEVWAIEAEFVVGLTGMDWVNSFTSLPWAEGGAHFGDGVDTATVMIARLVPTATGTTVLNTFDVTARLQFALSVEQPMGFVVAPDYGSRSDNANYRSILENPAAVSAGFLRSHYVARYVPALAPYPAGPDGWPDLTELLDETSNSFDRHAWLGLVRIGSSGAWVPTWVVNWGSGEEPNVWYGPGTARAEGVDHAGVPSSGARLRCVDVYNVASGQATPTGLWEFVFTSTTLFDVYLTQPGGARTQVATGKNRTADVTITVSSVNYLFIPVEAWTGTPAIADNFKVYTRGDRHNAGLPAANLDLVWVSEYVTGNKLSIDDGHARPLGGAAASQLQNDASVFAGVAADQTISSVDKLHIKVDNPKLFSTHVTHWGTIRKDNGQRIRVKILAWYDLDHGTYPGQLRLDTTAAAVGALNAQCYFTTGADCEDVAPRDWALLAAPTATNSLLIQLATPLQAADQAAGELQILDPATGESETFTTWTRSGSNVTAGSYPSRVWPAGAMVGVKSLASAASVYEQARPGASEPTGRRRCFGAFESLALVAR